MATKELSQNYKQGCFIYFAQRDVPATSEATLWGLLYCLWFKFEIVEDHTVYVIALLMIPISITYFRYLAAIAPIN